MLFIKQQAIIIYFDIVLLQVRSAHFALNPLTFL